MQPPRPRPDRSSPPKPQRAAGRRRIRRVDAASSGAEAASVAATVAVLGSVVRPQRTGARFQVALEVVGEESAKVAAYARVAATVLARAHRESLADPTSEAAGLVAVQHRAA